MLEIPVPGLFEGQSLTNMMAGETSGHRVVISEQGSLKSWIDYPWKLIRGEGETDVQLFDLASDPLERNNLAAERRDTAEQLGKRLDLVVGEHGDHEVLELEPGIEDPEHIERLRALGYVE